MTDTLGWRSLIGMVAPAANSCTQPELDALRPEGVTNHIERVRGMRPGETALPEAGLEAALASLLTAKPARVILAAGAAAFSGGEALHARLEARCGVGVSTVPAALLAGLRALGVAGPVVVLAPWQPAALQAAASWFAAQGVAVAGAHRLGGESAALTPHEIANAVRAADAPGVGAVLQLGCNVAAVALGESAEAWQGKPLLTANAALYWHALRALGIADRAPGGGPLLARC